MATIVAFLRGRSEMGRCEPEERGGAREAEMEGEGGRCA